MSLGLTRNPDAREVKLYTVEIVQHGIGRSIYHNVVSLFKGEDGVVMEVLKHGVDMVRLREVAYYNQTEQPTLIVVEDE